MNKLAALVLALMPAIVATAEPAAGKAPPAPLASPEISSANVFAATRFATCLAF